MFNDALSGAAKEQARDCAPAVRSDDDQIDIEMVCHEHDLIKRISDAQVRLDLDSFF